MIPDLAGLPVIGAYRLSVLSVSLLLFPFTNRRYTNVTCKDKGVFFNREQQTLRIS